MLAAAVAAHPAAVAIELMNEPPTLDNPGLFSRGGGHSLYDYASVLLFIWGFVWGVV